MPAAQPSGPPPSTVKQPRPERNPLVASFAWLWNRYSPNGEFPISTAASTMFHILVFALIGLFAMQLLPPDLEPVPVVSVRVGPEPEAAKGEGDDTLPGDVLEQGNPNEIKPEDTPPEVTPAEKIEEVKPPTINETGPKPASEAIEKNVQEAERAARRAASAVDQAKEALQKNLSGKSGGGGGSGATGRAARPSRWILNFSFNGTDDYLRQLEGLGATLAFPVQGNNWKFFPKPSSNRSQSETRDLSTESRLYWVNEDAAMANQMATTMGMSGAQFVTIFLPKTLEDRMLDLELQYMNLEEDEIASTRFQCFSTGSGYDVKVISQIPK
jgi:hypothetical protein